MRDLRKLIYTALLVSMALAVSLIENMIPVPFIAPGAKLGLSNIVILVSLLVFGFKTAATVALLKSFLLMLVAGFGPSFLYSFAGAILSTLVMGFAYRFCSNIFSTIGISILGAVAHNLAQVFVASLILGNFMIFTYFPLLTIVGTITGYFVGLSAYHVSTQLKKLIKA